MRRICIIFILLTLLIPAIAKPRKSVRKISNNRRTDISVQQQIQEIYSMNSLIQNSIPRKDRVCLTVGLSKEQFKACTMKKLLFLDCDEDGEYFLVDETPLEPLILLFRDNKLQRYFRGRF